MTKSSKRLLIYLSTILPITIAAVTLRTVALFLYIDDGLIYFTSNTLITVASAIMMAFCLFSVSYSFIPGQKVLPASSFVNPRTYIPSGLVAISMLFIGGELLSDLMSQLASAKKTDITVMHIILILTTVLAFVCTINFFLNVFYEKRQSRSRAAFSMCAVLFFALYAGYLFFSTDLPINSPNKAVDQMAFVSLSVFFLYETRISLGRHSWNPYVTFGMIASALSLFSSIPALIFYFVSGAVEDAVISQSVAENVLILVSGIYTLSRLSLVLTLVPDEVCNTALAFEKMAKLREDEMESARIARENLDNEEKTPETHDFVPKEGANYEMDFGNLTPSVESSENKDKE